MALSRCRKDVDGLHSGQQGDTLLLCVLLVALHCYWHSAIACYAFSAGCRGFATDTKGFLDGAEQLQQLIASGK